MIKVGAFEAKTHLSSLLEKVKAGEEVLITRHGKAIARLVPADQAARSDLKKTISDVQNLRKSMTLGSLDWRELRDEGRR